MISFEWKVEVTPIFHIGISDQIQAMKQPPPLPNHCFWHSVRTLIIGHKRGLISGQNSNRSGPNRRERNSNPNVQNPRVEGVYRKPNIVLEPFLTFFLFFCFLASLGKEWKKRKGEKKAVFTGVFEFWGWPKLLYIGTVIWSSCHPRGPIGV